MKKILCIGIILIAGFGLIRAYPQGIPVYTIPSYNIEVDGYANFVENYNNSNSPNQVLGKRQVNVQVMSGTRGCQAYAWVYSLDRTTILGPYSVNCDDALEVDIDGREWGVLVGSEDDVLVDVWINQPELLLPKNSQIQRFKKF